MSKGIAITTILTLLLGILVVGIVVYLVYTYGMGPGLDIEGCRSRVVNWCTGCSIADWSGTMPGPSRDLQICIPKYFSGSDETDWADANCNTCPDGDTEDFCASFLAETTTITPEEG